MCVLSTSKSYSSSNFQVYNIVLLTIVTLMHSRIPRSYSSYNWKSVPFANISPFYLLHSPWKPPFYSVSISKIIPYLCFSDLFHLMFSWIIHVVANGRISLFLMSKQCPITHRDTHIRHIFSIHSSMDKHLGCSHSSAIMNKAAVNLGVQISLWDSHFISFWNIPRHGIAGSHVSLLFLIFVRNYTLVK